MAQNLPLDQIATVNVVGVDRLGNVVPLPADAVSTFTNSTPATATDAPSGNTDVLTPVGAVGAATTLSVSVVTGGQTFTFSDTFTLVAAAIAGVQFQTTFSPKP